MLKLDDNYQAASNQRPPVLDPIGNKRFKKGAAEVRQREGHYPER
jgi:hypothetical protein